jgi:hypothetical protein
LRLTINGGPGVGALNEWTIGYSEVISILPSDLADNAPQRATKASFFRRPRYIIQAPDLKKRVMQGARVRMKVILDTRELQLLE